MSTFWGPFGQAPNILILITDQQRTPQHLPPGWVEKHLPNLWSLMQGGVSFPNAMTNTAACSPSRATLFTSTFPMLNGVESVGAVLKLPQSVSTSPNVTLPLATLGQVLTTMAPDGITYEITYKGKWHIGKFTSDLGPTEQYDRASTLQGDDSTMQTTYGFPGWTSPDFGTAINLGANTLGGGVGANDARVVIGDTWTVDNQGQTVTVKNAAQFLNTYQPNADGTNPFCLVVSLANPHDVFVSPNDYEQAGYSNPNADGKEPWQVAPFTELELPANYALRPEQLDNKPHAQQVWRQDYTDEQALDYVRFYAYLQTLSDALLGQVLAAMSDTVAANTLVVRLADHGEMGMSQGQMIEKEHVVYNEALLVPMIFAHPRLAGGGTNSALVGLIDVLPTIAEICGISEADLGSTYAIQGKSLATTLWHQAKGKDLEGPNELLFATDDTAASGGNPWKIRCLVEAKDYNAKYAVYYLASADSPYQCELYDFSRDAGARAPEMTNLVPVDGLTSEETAQWDSVQDLWHHMHERLTQAIERANLPALPNWPTPPPKSNNGLGTA